MELTPGVILVVAVVAVAGVVLLRWGRRHEAAPPVEGPDPRLRSSTIATRVDGDSNGLVKWLLDRAFEQTGVRVDHDALARQRITEAATKAMEDLRARGSAEISLPFLVADARGPRHFSVRVKRNVDSTLELEQ